MGICLYIMLLAIVAIILWKISAIARYYFKFIIFCVLSWILASAPIPLMLLKPRDSRNALIPAAGLRFASRLIGIKASLEGHENIIKNSGCVVLMNHQSILDLIILANLWPAMDNCTVISKKEIFYLQPFGTASWLWGTIFIDRVKKEDSQKAVNKTGQTIRTRKARVLMFPEGTRNDKTQLLPFKKGAFHLALASQCPIQPVVINRYGFLSTHKFDNGHIRIRILPAISTDGYTTENINELIDKTYKVMSEGVNSLTAEMVNNNNKKFN